MSVTAFLEVPLTADILDLPRRPGLSVDWLPRNGAPRGGLLHAAVLQHLGVRAEVPELSDDEVDPALWETPHRTPADSGSSTYAWIAGESKVVTGLRRALVNDLGFDRSSVAFMGYWRDGVAMKS